MQNVDTLVNLINAVKNHPKIFTNLAQNDDERKEWTLVAEECGTTITEAQDQWNLILIEYVEYLRNNQDFSLAAHMDFLQPYFFSINDGEDIDEDDLLNAIESKRFEGGETYSQSTKNEDTNLRTTDMEKNTKSEQTGKIKMASTFVNEIASSKASCKSVVPSQDSSFTNLSSLELIFLGYAKQLQKMPLPIQLKTKRKIADIMDEAELQMINL